MTIEQRILEISYNHKLSHLGSCITAAPILKDIYTTKQPNDIVVLSSGHVGLALYCVLEQFEGKNAEELFLKHGVHPNRDLEDGLYCSSGSLGHGLPIAIGMAIADKTRNVYCLISDGESFEGTIWEALNFINEFEVTNLFIYVNINGYSAYKKVDSQHLVEAIKAHLVKPSVRDNIKFYYLADYVNARYKFLDGLDAHYHVMTKEEYESTLC